MPDSGETGSKATYVLVDGANGYIGSHLVKTLADKEFSVRALVRKAVTKPEEIDYLRSFCAEVVEVDYQSLSEEDASKIFDSVECMVHLIGSIAPKRGETLDHLHRDLTQKLVGYGKKFGLKKVIHITALGTSANSASNYHRTKWLAEEVVRQSGINYTILRPSLIIGHKVGERHSKLVKRLIKFIESRPFVPLINGGYNKVQPIYVDDVALAIAAAIDSSEDSSTIELGGDTVISMRDLVGKLAQHKKRKTKILALNQGIGKAIASVVEKFQDVPVISEDQVVLSLSDNVCQTNGFQSLVGRPPCSLDDAIATYPCK